MEIIKVSRLVKSEDLNHHGTLFAGRMAEWFVESSFICGAKVTEKPENIVCANVHGMSFKAPINKGDIVNLQSRIVKVGRTSFAVYSKVTRNNDHDIILCDGYITFVFVDENDRPIPHGMVLNDPIDQEDILLREGAENLR